MNVSHGAGRLVGIGTDIIHLPRISRLLEKYTLNNDLYASDFHRVAKKFMHQVELKQLETMLKDGTASKTRLNTFVGGVWAAKESTFKAFSNFVVLDDMPPAQNIYTKLVYKTYGKSGSPKITFDTNFKDHSPANFLFFDKYVSSLKLTSLISISHDNDYLVCYVNLISN